MSRLFLDAAHSQLYKLFRPVYPAQLLECILSYTRRVTRQLDTCIDLGCGSGQSTYPLCEHFTKVIGVDTSQSQITEALGDPQCPANAVFRVGSAENLSFMADNSVDLISVAQTFHWVDKTKFYPECTRVLRSGGVLAVYGYGNMMVENKVSNAAITKFYKETLWGNNLWDERRQHIDTHYEEFSPLPLDDFQRVDDMMMVKRMSLQDMVGYISTWSAYRTLLKDSPSSKVLEELHQQLRVAYHTEDSQACEVEVKWPVFLLLGRKSGVLTA